ncbi:hypothetical protein LguiA_031410 [Lonicera macranthoides]
MFLFFYFFFGPNRILMETGPDRPFIRQVGFGLAKQASNLTREAREHFRGERNLLGMALM